MFACQTIRRIALIGAVLLAWPASSAEAIVVGINIDVHQDVVGPPLPNDFHIEGRIESGDPDGTWSQPPVLLDHVDDQFPNFQYSIQPDPTDPAGNWYVFSADWSLPAGSPGIAHCTILHLGLFFDVTCHNILIDLVGWWTLDGAPIGAGVNQGNIPVVGFNVEDAPTGGPQFMQLFNHSGGGGGGGGAGIDLEIVDMDLAALSREEIHGEAGIGLGHDPFEELRIGGLQEDLPWVQVWRMGAPVSEANPIPFWVESFFDVMFDGTGPIHPEEPIVVQPGGFLIARELARFTGNDGSTEYRWFWEMHGAHEPPPPPPPPPPPVTAGFNVDIHQDNFGLVANDFHIEGRIESGVPLSAGGGGWSSPPKVIDQVNDLFPFWNIQITPDPNDPEENWYLVTADWWGAEILYCQVLHLGVWFEVTCHNVIIDLVGWWTKDGAPLQGGQNQGAVPILGFDVQDNINVPPEPEGQRIRIQNGNGNGIPEPGEIPIEIVQLELVGIAPGELEAWLGDAPLRELRIGGRQEMLPWMPVLHPDGTPVSESNPLIGVPDSFFDVFFEIPQADELRVLGAFRVQPGGNLVARERVRFINNSGEPDFRWVWELHGAHEEEPELGDAPDSSNNFGIGMTAYPPGGPAGVPANYPSVYLTGSPPHGPIHWLPFGVAFLGPWVTTEVEADVGFDSDGINNIVPPQDVPDLDNADDGVNFPIALPHCAPTWFTYLVNVVAGGTQLYVNVWWDFNRDGDWDDTLVCPAAVGAAPEWAVRNQALFFPLPGMYVVTTPAFIPWHPTAPPQFNPLWMRITLSEQPWDPTLEGQPGYGGSGPAGGYTFGETEDYYYPVPLPACGNGICEPPVEDSCNCPQDCGAPPANEVPGQTCGDGLDNDCDGCTDGTDADCGGIETVCADGADDDCDGAVDCNDADCLTDPVCQQPGVKWSQAPDLTPMGMDVNATFWPGMPYVLADDFLCTQTGPVAAVHIYGSWYQDRMPFGDPMAVSFTVSFHRDIPASENPFGNWSMPGEILWIHEYQPGECVPTLFAGGLEEGWLEPPDWYEPFGDTMCWMYVCPVPDGKFVQEGTPENPVIYWLDVQARPVDETTFFGWKTSTRHWNDDAVWGMGVDPPTTVPPWKELRYPPGHPMFPMSIDLAFELIPGPPVNSPDPPPFPYDRRKNRFVSFGPSNGSAAVAYSVEWLDKVCAVSKVCQGGGFGSNDGTACTSNANCTLGGRCLPRPCVSASDCKVCFGGTSDGRPCTVNADCPGGGTCAPSGETCDQQNPPVLLGWASMPHDPGCQDAYGNPIVGSCTGHRLSRLLPNPVFRDWSGDSEVHLGDCQIAPCYGYGVRATLDGLNFSAPLELGTIEKPQAKYWGDCVGNFVKRCAHDGTTVCTTNADCPPGVICGYWTPCNQFVNVDDVVAWVKYVTLKPAPHVTVMDMGGEEPNLIINATDLQMILQGFGGKVYPPTAFPTHVCVGGVNNGLPCDPADPTDCPGGTCMGFDATTCPL